MPLFDDPWLPAPDHSGQIPAYRPACPVGVYRSDGTTLAPIANLECLSIAFREGTDPGHARFRYDLASGLAGAPTSIEQALGTGTTGSGIVEPGDRLVVLGMRPDGGTEPLFDGEATNFALDLGPDSEEVHIDCVGIAWRCWDRPIRGALIRDASDPKKVNDTRTDVVAHFNPGGLPNATPVGYEAGARSGARDRAYPVFLEPRIVRTPDLRTSWYLSMACRHVLFTENEAEDYVRNPDGADIDALLGTVDGKGNPIGGPPGGPVVVPDLPISGKDWPGTVQRLLGEVGFGQKFQLSAGDGGIPTTDLVFFAQQGGAVKDLYLAPRGTPFSPALCNLSASSLHRDVSGVVNKWSVRGGMHLWEASFVLACGFPCSSGDASASALAGFNTNDPSYVSDGTKRDAYRLYVFDETGEGHYPAGSATKDSTVPPLDGLFGAGRYAQRRRRPIGTLLSLDAAGKPYRARLAISKNYAGPKPGLWDGTGTWQTLTSSTFRLLSDRLGITITDTSPNSWDVGKSRVAGAPYPSGVVKGVEDQASATAADHFTLRLTCVVEADEALFATADPTGGSPIARPISRIIDASDRYVRSRVDYPSEFNASGNLDKVVRDDTELARAEAVSMRASTQAGTLGGPCEIPRLTNYYKIGDRIRSIDGRGLGLRTDSGTGDGAPIYPVVVGIRWDFEGGQKTTLELSDAGSDRRRYTRKPRRVLRDSNGKPRFNRHGG